MGKRGPTRNPLSASGQAKTASDLVDKWISRCLFPNSYAKHTFPELYASYGDYVEWLYTQSKDEVLFNLILTNKGLGMALHHREFRFRQSNGKRIYLGMGIKPYEEAFSE